MKLLGLPRKNSIPIAQSPSITLRTLSECIHPNVDSEHGDAIRKLGLYYMRKILLAEDDPFILDIYSTYLKKEGYGVDIAKDGQMALEKIKISKPDILLLDLDLPKLNGRDVLKVLRSEPSTKDLKVMIISNHNQQDYPDVVSQLGIIKYFLKIETTVQDIARAIEEALK